jgi:hypothetical protein
LARTALLYESSDGGMLRSRHARWRGARGASWYSKHRVVWLRHHCGM